jgi:hypothetical protein
MVIDSIVGVTSFSIPLLQAIYRRMQFGNVRRCEKVLLADLLIIFGSSKFTYPNPWYISLLYFIVSLLIDSRNLFA